MAKLIFKTLKDGSDVADNDEGKCMARWCNERTYKVVRGPLAPEANKQEVRLCDECYARWRKGETIIMVQECLPKNFWPALTELQKALIARSKLPPEERESIPLPTDKPRRKRKPS